MQILKSLSRWGRISKVTYSLVRTFDAVFEPFGGVGVVGEKLPDDEFIIAYMFGLMTRFFDAHWTVGMTESPRVLLKCYERTFRGRGTDIVELATTRIKAGDESFMRSVQAGSREAHEYLATQGKSGLPGLTAYLRMRIS